MQLSPELNLIISSIKLCLLNKNREEFLSQVKSSDLNWQRVHQLLNYHQISPVFFHACKEVSFQNEYVDQYEIFSKRQAILNLIYEKEYLRIADLFLHKGIRVIPYKGVLFLKKLYNEKAIRQMTDLDILVHENDAVEALTLLIKEGYKIKEKVDSSPETLKRLIEDIPNKEISLIKSSLGGNTIWLDFHWHINVFKQSELDINTFLDGTIKESWGGKDINIPKNDSVFIMLLNHHGERDCWTKLKYICDLWMYLHEYSFIPIEELERNAKGVKMVKVFSGGLQLIAKYLGEPTRHTFEVQESILDSVVNMWEMGKHWDHILPKIRLLVLYKKFQDQKVSWFWILNQQIELHSKKGFDKPKRLIDFPDKYRMLNSLSKLGGYLVERVFRK
jgi:hypothetical protein